MAKEPTHFGRPLSEVLAEQGADYFEDIPGKEFKSLEEAAFGRKLSPIEFAVKMDRIEASQESLIADPLGLDRDDG